MNKLLITSTLLTLFSLAFAGSPCPKNAEIIPCQCSKLGLQTIVKCDYPDTGLLNAALVAMSKRKMFVDQVFVKNSALTDMGSEFFNEITVREVSFQAPRWTSITNTTFEGQEYTLEVLSIEQSSLVELPVESIENLLYLTKLQLINSEITSIDDGAFDNMKSVSSLHHVDLSLNYIRYIGSKAFSALVNLKQLNLARNRIRNLPPKFLPQSNNIMKFIIAQNQIESLSDEVEMFPKGSNLDFSDNAITTISGKVLKTMIAQSFKVNLLGNALECTCNFRILTIFNSIDSIKGDCQEPSEVSGKSLKDLKSDDFKNCFRK